MTAALDEGRGAGEDDVGEATFVPVVGRTGTGTCPPALAAGVVEAAVAVAVAVSASRGGVVGSGVVDAVFEGVDGVATDAVAEAVGWTGSATGLEVAADRLRPKASAPTTRDRRTMPPPIRR